MTPESFEIAREWLADAPLFIDAAQVESFFDAIATPTDRLGIVTLTLGEGDTVRDISEKAKAGEASLKILKGSLGKTDSHEESETTSKNRAIVYEPIRTPQRQLSLLASHYQDNYEKRAFYVTDPTIGAWRDAKEILETPRALVFLDLPGRDEAKRLNVPSTKFIPMAAELENGKIIPIFKTLHARSGERPPKYPAWDIEPAEFQKLKTAYWEWYDKNFDPLGAMAAVEKAASKNGRIRWIDFQVPITSGHETLHVHMVPGGKYDTGVFAYNCILRGFKFGLRLVGTLKSDPDMNVLAVYDK